MRRKRRRRKRTLRNNEFIIYNFENLEINSFVELTDTQVDLIYISVKNIINSNNCKTSYEI